MKKKFFYLIFLLLSFGMLSSLRAQTPGSWVDHADISFMNGGVTGEAGDPYVIKTADQLAGLASQVNQGQTFSGKHFELGGNIDLGLYYWEPIGNSNPLAGCFSGIFDGKGLIISNLKIKSDYTSDGVGLFGHIDGAEINNVHLEKLNILVTAPSRIGGLAGVSKEGSIITECSITGVISGFSYIGGLVGQAIGTDLVKCYSFCIINSDVNFERIGGLVGSLEQGSNKKSTLSSCYSMGIVSAERLIGGLVGVSLNSEVRNSYTTATVTGTDKGSGAYSIGGIIGDLGRTVLSNCFARNVKVGGKDDESVRRVVGEYNPTASSLLNNYAREDMLISRNSKFGPLPDDEEVGLNTPNGESVPDDFAWCNETDDDGDWICGNDPYLKYQSAPPIVTTSSTIQMVVKFDLDVVDINKIEKIVLLDSKYEEIINADTINPANVSADKIIWTFTPKPEGSTFTVGQVFYAVAYETDKTASLPVKITITPYEEGNGTKNNPFIIKNEALLDAVRDTYTTPKYSNYKLVRNLDMSTYKDGEGNLIEFKPVGTEKKPFPGSFEGGGHIIYNLIINGGETEDYQGLFGYINSNDTIKNLGLENVAVTGRNQVGALAGKSNAVFQNIYTTGTVNATGDYVGGLQGLLDARTELGAGVLSSYSTCLVKGKNYVGGLIGYAASTVMDCYATGPVFGNNYFGGLLGEIASSNVTYCYSTGLVTGTATACKGGLIGLAVGAIQVSGYFDINTSGVDTGIGSAGGATLTGAVTGYPTSTLASTDASNYFPTLPNRPTNFSFLKDNYPQLNAFINPKFGDEETKSNVKYCSALSVVPVNFENNEKANRVETSFDAPSEYIVGSETKELVPLEKVISTLQTGEVDTLKITIQQIEDLNIRERSRDICFIPYQQFPTCVAARTAGEPNKNGWSNKNVTFELSAKELNADNWIGGHVKYQQKTGANAWEPLSGNTYSFDSDTIATVKYSAFNGGGTGKDTTVYVNIDKIRPDIKDVSTNGTRENPAPKNNATLTVKVNDFPPAGSEVVSGMAKVKWEVKNGISKDSITVFSPSDVVNGYFNPVFNLPPQSGRYEVLVTAEDKAGNKINNEEAGFPPLEVNVGGDLGDYILDNVTVDGDSAKVDVNDPLIWWYKDVCVDGETAEVTLYPAKIFGLDPVTVKVNLDFGDNPVKITLEAKDVIMTFTVHICRKTPVASFMTLTVDKEPIPLKVGKFTYTLLGSNGKVKWLPNDREEVIAEYTLANGVKCDKPTPYTFENLTEGKNPIELRVTEKFGGKDSTNVYVINVYREAKEKPNPIDDIDTGGFIDDPADKDDNPNPDNPFFDGVDENGNLIIGYNLRTKCGQTEPHILTVNPQTADGKSDPKATVTFYVLNDAGKVISFDETNSYRFDIANYYNLRVTVAPETGYPRNYNFYIVKRFEKENIFYQRWSDVLAVISNSTNNGSYSFNDDGYEWRITDNDGILKQELDDITSYISVAANKTYVARLTGKYTDSKGNETQISQVPTCPCEIGTGTQASIFAYPSILKAGEKVTVSIENMSDIDLNDANVSIVSSMGNVLRKFSLTGSKTEIEMPEAQGIYLLKVSTKSITKDFKVILK